jgi:hypothetical protein
VQCVENVRGAKELCVCVSQNLLEALKWLGNAFWDRKQEGKDMPTWVIAVAAYFLKFQGTPDLNFVGFF